MGLYRSSYTGSPVEIPLCPLEVYKLLLETIVAELARANAIRSNKWHVHHALSPYGHPNPPSSYSAPLQAPSDNRSFAMDARTSPVAGPANELSGSDHPGSPTQDHKASEHAPPAAPLTTPPQVDSPQPLSQAAGAQTSWRPGPTRLHFNSAPRGVQQQPGLGTPVGDRAPAN